MTWLQPALLTTAVVSFAVAIIYYYFYRQENERALVVWSVSWLVYSLRFFSQLGMLLGMLPPFFVVVQQVVSLISAILFIWGTCLFLEKRFSPVWGLGGLVCFGWVVAGYFFPLSFLLYHLPVSLFIGAVFVGSGMMLKRSAQLTGGASRLTGWSLILWGFHKMNYPILRPVQWFAPWGFMIASLLFILSAVGVLFVYYERAKRCIVKERREKEVQEERFRKIVETTSDAIILADDTGLILHANKGAELIFGHEQSGLIGSPLSSIMPHRFRKQHEEGLARFLQTGVSKYLNQTLSLTGLKKDGTEFPVDLNLTTWTGGDNRPYFAGLVRDMTSYHEIERKLSENNALLTSLVDSIPDLIFYKDMQGAYLGCNEAFTRFTGRGKERIVGHTDYDFFPEEFARFFRDNDQRMLGLGEPRRNEEWVSYPDGRKVYLETVKTPYRDQNGKLLGLIGISRDITERIKTEEDLRKNHSLLNAVVEGTSDAIFIKNLKGEYIYANRSTVETFGKKSADEVLGKTDADLFPTLSVEVIKNADSKVLVEEETVIAEEVLETAQGKTVWLTNKTPFYSEIGKMAGLIGISRNITEQRDAARAIREGEQFLSDVFDSIQDGISVLDTDYTILTVNHTMEQMYPEMAPLAGRKCYEAYHGKSSPCKVCPTRLAISSDSLESVEVPFVQNGEQKGELEIFAYPMHDMTGEISGVVEYVRDISLRKTAAAERTQLEDQLRQLQKMEAIGTLAGGIAHDFNNILVPIIAYTEMVAEKLPAESQEKSDLAQVLNAGKRARELVKQILTFSREREGALQPLNVVPVVKESLKLLKASLPSNISIRQDIADSVLIIEADPTQLHQVVMNICTNAYHAMAETGGTLHVSLLKIDEQGTDLVAKGTLLSGPCLKMTIADTGSGIPPENMERIFEPYFSTKKKEEGTGLGLSVVHGIIKNCGGEITVDSTLGEGTAFNVFFPLVLLGDSGEDKPQAEQQLPGGKEHILLVDDEEFVVRSLERVLTLLGYKVTGQKDGKDALELFQKNPGEFDLVITDQAMPCMTGDQLATELIKIRLDIPIILCTGFSSMIDEERAQKIGIQAFLLKPVLRTKLAETVRQLLDPAPSKSIEERGE